MMKSPFSIGIVGVFLGFISMRLLDLSLALTIIFASLIATHALLGLPKWIAAHAFSALGIKDSVMTRNKLVGLLFLSTISLFVEIEAMQSYRATSAYLVMPILLASVLAISLICTHHVSGLLSRILAPLGNSTFVPPQAVRNPKPWTSKLVFGNRMITVATSAALSLSVIVGVPLYIVSIIVATAVSVVLVSNAFVLKAIYSPEAREALASQEQTYSAKIRGEIEKLEPTAVLYHAGRPSKALTNAISTLTRSGKRFYVIVRNKPTFLALRKAKTKNLVLCSKLAEIEPLLPNTITQFYYTNTHSKNVHVIRYYERQHILINSPEDAMGKSPSYGMFTHRLVKSTGGNYRLETIDGNSSEFDEATSAINAIS